MAQLVFPFDNSPRPGMKLIFSRRRRDPKTGQVKYYPKPVPMWVKDDNSR